MATSDKWRLYITANNGHATLVDLADIQFRTAVGVPRYFDFDTAYWDFAYSVSSDSSGADSLFDGDASYSWVPNLSGGAWVQVDYDAPITIVAYAMRSGYASEATKCPKDFTLEYWNGSSWVAADTQTNQTSWGAFATREYTVGTAGYVSRTGMITESSTQWRVNVTAVNGATKIGIDDFQLHNLAYVGSDIHQDDMEPYPDGWSASTTEAGSAAANVTGFDTSAWKSDGTTTGWVQVDFPWVFEPVEYKIVGTNSTETPRDWTLEYWDGVAWIVADTRAGITATSGVYTITPAAPPSNDGDIEFLGLTLDGNMNEPDNAMYGGVLALLGLTASGTLIHGNDGHPNLGDPNNLGTSFAATPFTLSASAVLSSVYTGDAFFPDFVLEGSLEGPLPLPALTLSASGFAGTVSTGLIILPGYSLAGGIDDQNTLPMLELSAVGESGAVVQGDITLPLASLAGSMEPALALPELDLNGTMLAGTVANGNAVLLNWSLAAAISEFGDCILPLIDVDGTGLAGNVANGDVTLAKFSVAATHFQDGTATGAAELPQMTLAGTVLSSSVNHGEATLATFSLSATALSGAVMTADITVPLLSLDADGYFSVVGTATIELPMLQLSGTMQSAALVAPQFNVIALNTRTKAVSTYTNSPFNSYAQFGGLTLAASAAGIVALAGDTDDGVAIDAYLLSGITDFENESKKRVLAGYVGYRAAGGMDLTLITDQHHEFIYRMEPRQEAADLHTARVKTGRGVDGRFWQWKLANRAGCDFEVSTITLEADILKRRV